MKQIIEPMFIVASLGAILGLLLGVANRYLKVEVDPRIEKVTSLLPGYNCGACGCAGCAGFAESIVTTGANVKSCTPCSAENKVKIVNYLKEN